MSKERCIVNEVIVVGKLVEGKEDIVIPKLTTDNKEEVIQAMRNKFRFIRKTKENGKIASSKFFHILASDFGGQTKSVAGREIKISRETSRYAWKVLFESKDPITFDEIKEEIVNSNFDIVGDGKEGKIRLTKYGLLGFWDEFPLGFTHRITQRNAEGKVVPVLAWQRDDNGKWTQKEALSNSGQHFVLYSEVENLEVLRENIRTNARKTEVRIVDNTDPSRTGVQEVSTTTETKSESEDQQNTPPPDDDDDV